MSAMKVKAHKLQCMIDMFRKQVITMEGEHVLLHCMKLAMELGQNVTWKKDNEVIFRGIWDVGDTDVSQAAVPLIVGGIVVSGPSAL